MELVESSTLSSEEIANSSSDIVERLRVATDPEPQSLLPLDLNSTNVVISILLDVSQELNVTVNRVCKHKLTDVQVWLKATVPLTANLTLPITDRSFIIQSLSPNPY